ncbi:MAG: hypothetical protein ACI4SJ_04695 [Candidatus Avispirillum sp.]
MGTILYTETVEAVSYNPHIPGGRAYGARFAYGARGIISYMSAKKYRGTAAAKYVVLQQHITTFGRCCQ